MHTGVVRLYDVPLGHAVSHGKPLPDVRTACCEAQHHCICLAIDVAERKSTERFTEIQARCSEVDPADNAYRCCACMRCSTGTRSIDRIVIPYQTCRQPTVRLSITASAQLWK